MIQKVKEIAIYRAKKHRQFIIYGLIGVVGICVDYGLFALFYKVFGMDPVLANNISGVLAITNNFTLNLLFNFKVTDKILQRFIFFAGFGVAGMLATDLTLEIFANRLGFNALIVKLIALFIVIIIQYNLNRTISFKKTDQ